MCRWLLHADIVKGVTRFRLCARGGEPTTLAVTSLLEGRLDAA